MDPPLWAVRQLGKNPTMCYRYRWAEVEDLASPFFIYFYFAFYYYYLFREYYYCFFFFKAFVVGVTYFIFVASSLHNFLV